MFFARFWHTYFFFWIILWQRQKLNNVALRCKLRLQFNETTPTGKHFKSAQHLHIYSTSNIWLLCLFARAESQCTTLDTTTLPLLDANKNNGTTTESEMRFGQKWRGAKNKSLAEVEMFTAEWRPCAAAGRSSAGGGWRPRPQRCCGGGLRGCGSCGVRCSCLRSNTPSLLPSCCRGPCHRTPCTCTTSSRCLEVRDCVRR